MIDKLICEQFVGRVLSGFQPVSVVTISQQFLLLCPMNVIFGLCSFFCLGCQ